MRDQGTINCLCLECHRGKSGRRDLTPGTYASDTSYPVLFSSLQLDTGTTK